MALLDASHLAELGQYRAGRAQRVHQLESMHGAVGGQDPFELGERPLGRDPGEPAGASGCRRPRARVDLEAELARETREPERPQGVIDERARGHHPQ